MTAAGSSGRRPSGAPENRPGDGNDRVVWLWRTAPLLAVFWLVLSGHYTALLLVLGTGSVVLVCWLSWRAGLAEGEGASFTLVLRLPRYLLWLGKEVIGSAVGVLRTVWSPRPDLRPTVEVTPSPDLTPLAQVIYANSITFTPGTLSLDLDEEQIKVHSLDPASLESLHSGRMLGRVRRLEVRR